MSVEYSIETSGIYSKETFLENFKKFERMLKKLWRKFEKIS